MSIVQDIRTAFSRRDNTLIQLILLNVLVFAALIVLRTILTVSSASGYYPPVMRQFELSSALPILLRHPWTLLTYAFTHEGFFRILFNMLNLYWFGQLVREYLGDRRLVSIYVLGALAGAGLAADGIAVPVVDCMACGFDFVIHLGQVGFGLTQQQHGGAMGGVGFRRRRANPATGAGHQDHPAFEQFWTRRVIKHN